MIGMVERVARALCGPDADALVIPQKVIGIGPKGFPFKGPDPVPAWTMFIADAVVAIKAMREPTDAMVETGFQNAGNPCWQEDIKRAWQAMIGEALK